MWLPLVVSNVVAQFYCVKLCRNSCL